tara:strand:- start:1229 stop:1360 length:132 start_codon:yes stop_codon:yes gene_type:complete
MKISQQTLTLITLAEYLRKYGQPVPIDVQSRLLAAGIDIKKYQ